MLKNFWVSALIAGLVVFTFLFIGIKMGQNSRNGDVRDAKQETEGAIHALQAQGVRLKQTEQLLLEAQQAQGDRTVQDAAVTKILTIVTDALNMCGNLKESDSPLALSVCMKLSEAGDVAADANSQLDPSGDAS
jgi:hypothetical protein